MLAITTLKHPHGKVKTLKICVNGADTDRDVNLVLDQSLFGYHHVKCLEESQHML